ADFDRPLNKRGRKAARALARYFLDLGQVPPLVLCSPACRTRQTLKPLARRLGAALSVHFEPCIYEASARRLLGCLTALPDDLTSVLLIGHNPGIEGLVHFLIEENGAPEAMARLRGKFPTGSLAILSHAGESWASLTAGACHLDVFIRPIDLESGG
ncbi:MAG TPA: histidine phosphatase family protein, partial [Rhodospirillaceae bacterium]|nr:histidine phosphatase family protein [Rhodospirillaceae bacterium]